MLLKNWFSRLAFGGSFFFMVCCLLYSQAYGEEYHRILPAPLINLDPSQLEDANALQIMLQVADGLVTYDDNAVAPALAERWEISSDLKTYTFYLKAGLKFSDGSPIVTDDVIRSFEHMLSKSSVLWKEISIIKGATEFHDGKSNKISGIEKVSDRIVRIHITKPFSPFLDILAAPPYAVLPQKSLQALSEKKVAPFVGSGPYQIDDIQPQHHIHLSKNKFYRSEKSIHFNEIRYDVVTDPAVATEGFLSGKYDDIWPYFVDRIPENLKSNFKIIPSFTSFTYYLQFNPSRKNVSNLSLRKFIASKIDIDGFIKNLGLPAHYRAYGLIPRGMLGYRDRPHVEPSATSEQLLRNAGCSASSKCEIEIIYAYNVDEGLRILLAPLKKYSDVFSVRLKKLSRQEWFERFMKGNFEVNYIGNNPLYFDTYLFLRVLDDKMKSPGIDRSRITPLLEEALKINDKGARARIYQEVDDLLVEQVGIIPIYHGEKPSKQIRTDITGYSMSILGYPYLRVMKLKREKSHAE